ncbi:general substrate transporter [Naematelia encephala]|uniref:General substrate transporter n=1 Tax=Naematelia encephala TaxID=71784 RepID=A0A1Y2B9P0_9TREE|nr:general substrate transporter [Naematelia encephala]
MGFTVYGAPIGWTSIVLAVLASMGGFIFGYDTGQISDILLMEDFLRRFGQKQSDGTYAFSNVREGLIVALLSIGTLIGAVAGSYISNWIGRRRAMSVFCAVFSVGLLIQVCSFTSWVQIMMGRFIAGWGVGALSAAVPVYQSETAPKEIRGSLVSTYQLLITAGIFVAYAICIGTRYLDTNGASWRIPIALGWVWAVALGVGIMFMPESPRWLIQNGKFDAARISLAKVRGVPVESDHVEYAFGEIATDVKKEEAAGKGTWLECFIGHPGIPKLAYRTFLGMMLQALQQLTGANYFFYYGATVFQNVGLSDSYKSQLIFGGINFACTFFGIWVMERFGRRWPLIIGGVWQAAWLFAYASVGVTHDTTQRGTGQFLIAASALFIFGYASTWAPGIWILTGETFPTRTRQKQASLAVASNWIWNFLIAFFTPFITQNINYSYGYVFAGCNLFGAVFVYFFLYESSKLSLENVNHMYGAPGLKPWHSEKWLPEGWSTRNTEMEDSKMNRSQHLETAAKMTNTIGLQAGHRRFSDEETVTEPQNNAVTTEKQPHASA